MHDQQPEIGLIKFGSSLMADPHHERAFEKACYWLASQLVSDQRKVNLRKNGDLEHIISRLSTLQTLLDDEVAAFEKTASRRNAIALVLMADFVWQAIRVLGHRTGLDVKWLQSILPADHVAIDEETNSDLYGRVEKIVQDASWVFCLHSKLRHPTKEFPGDLLNLLQHPVEEGARDRLLRAAKAIQQVLVNVQVRLDPTIW